MIHAPDSTKSYTQDQIDDIANPPDRFPDEHAPMPQVVQHGGQGRCSDALRAISGQDSDIRNQPISQACRPPIS